MVDDRPIRLEDLDAVKERAQTLVDDAASACDVYYADLRCEAVESIGAYAENAMTKMSAAESVLSIGVRVIAGTPASAGYAGIELGVTDVAKLPERIREALACAADRAQENARRKAAARQSFGALGNTLAAVQLAPVPPAQATTEAQFRTDPRAITPAQAAALATEISREAAALSGAIKYNVISVDTELARHLFASSEGALIDQFFALTEGFIYVAASDGAPVELDHTMGHQRGWEVLLDGVDEPLIQHPPFRDFALELARDAVALSNAPVCPSTDRPVTVVTDPDYNALLAHEIIGHPTELDRALKMETAYAGRSWFFTSPTDNQLGRQVASPLVSASADPTLPGYGHYAYDDEGTPGRRVQLIDKGILTGFKNSRQTAAVLGHEPNGHYKAIDAALVPLVRMSCTSIEAGASDPAEILRDVADGYYLAGMRIPSIAESRENFRITARKVYRIERGELTTLHRDGGITSDSKAFLQSIDAVGSDFRILPIPNCGKGQPMQTRRLGNGAPTLRGNARMTGGAS